MAAPKTIVLKGHGIRKEVVAGGTVTPGHTLDFDGTVGGGARRAFAVENDLIGGGIDDDYASGDTVQYEVFPPGAEVYAILAASQEIDEGDGLESTAAGTLQALNEGDLVAYAAEDVTTTGAVARIRVEVA